MIEASHQTLTSAGFFVHQVGVKNMCQPPRHSQESGRSPTSALTARCQSSTGPHVFPRGQNSWCWSGGISAGFALPAVGSAGHRARCSSSGAGLALGCFRLSVGAWINT